MVAKRRPLVQNRDIALKELAWAKERALSDPEAAHVDADNAVFQYLHLVAPEIAEAYNAVQPKWYA